jgi:hypothetical protein
MSTEELALKARLESALAKIAQLEAALKAVMREWNRDVEYATVPQPAWKQAEDALGHQVKPRDLRSFLS